MSARVSHPAIIICGPTASGKSALAAAAAERFGGCVINADSMQIYRELPILTAQPDAAERGQAPHRLYGVLAANDPCSAGRWRDLAAAEMEDAHAQGLLPILCGGSGLYLQALSDGLAPTPPVTPRIREKVRALLAEKGSAALAAEIHRRDPEADPPGDPQRLARALEVLESTGRPLRHWQCAGKSDTGKDDAVAASSRSRWSWTMILTAAPRESLYAAIDRRFESMITAGGIEEVRSVMSLDRSLPALKAVGVPQLLEHLNGAIDLATAVTRAQTATRQYAKRQMTWFRNRVTPDLVLNTAGTETAEAAPTALFSLIARQTKR